MDPIAALQWVQNFYDSAWNKLIWVVGAGFAIVGLLMPILIQLYQRKSFKDETDRLEKEANKQIEESKRAFAEATDKLKKEIEERIKAEIDKLQILSEQTFGGLHMIQAQVCITNRDYRHALIDYANAIEHLLDGKDYSNSTISVERTKHLLGDHLSEKDFAIDPKIDKALNSLVDYLSHTKHEKRYDTEVEQIKKLWADAKKREPKAE